MTPPQRDPEGASVIPMEARAGENLRVIRETLERSAAFSTIPGWGGAAMGLSGAAAAVCASRAASPARWLEVWLAAALVACVIGITAMVRGARRAQVPLLAGPGRRFALVFSSAVLSGAVLTVGLCRAGQFTLLPALWLMLYGTALVGGGTISVTLVRSMGYGFLLLGAGAVFAPFAVGNWLLGAGFGVFQIIGGIILARRQRG
ncbi:MAG TPA: hypothetical protein VJW51_07320 [Candidatus Acidoferrales bacterium]|nr:hypothetical protein [Candidatus Acidoferrales bacterium]